MQNANGSEWARGTEWARPERWTMEDLRDQLLKEIANPSPNPAVLQDMVAAYIQFGGNLSLVQEPHAA